MKIGYIASHIYIHTFEINEAVELLRQVPDARIYSFYHARGDNYQKRRVAALDGKIDGWSLGSSLAGFVHLLVRRPRGLAAGAFLLARHSVANPVYWIKNFAVFWVAMSILADAHRRAITHLHANFGSSPATIAWLGRYVLGSTMSVTYHAFDIYSKAFTNRDPLKERKLRDADLVVSVHDDGLRFLRELVPDVPAEKFQVIHISVVFTPAEKADPLPNPPIVLAAGNLVRKKGFDVLIRAMAELKRRGVAAKGRILGEGPERDALQDLVRREGVHARVELAGFYQNDDMAADLAQAVAFAAPSRVTEVGQRDGIPTVIVEAWLSRTPVVASLVGGMGEVVVDGETGLVFPENDANALADALERLIESPELRERLAASGERVAKREFSAPENVRRLVEAIRRACGSMERATA